MPLQDFLFYFKLGWQHIVSLDALDHQLFILALVTVYTSKNLTSGWNEFFCGAKV